MKIKVSGQMLELDRPIEAIGITMIIAGVCLVLPAEMQTETVVRSGLFNLMLISVISGMLVLGLQSEHPVIASRLVIGVLSGGILLSAGWFGFPGLLALLALSVLLAMLLMNAWEMLAVAVLQVLVLAGLFYTLPVVYPAGEVGVAIFAICGVTVIAFLFLRQFIQLVSWSIQYWQQAQELNAKTADNQEKLEKALLNLSNANQLLVQANKRADRLRSVAEKAERTKSMFVARVSHEFRTPLNMIFGLVELMVEAPQIYAIRMPPELEKDLEVVLRNCRHLSNMIDDVLELTRAETGSISLHRGMVSLPEIIQEATLVVSPLVNKKDLALTIRYPEPLPEVFCDRTRIRQVILNLVSNACRFTESGGIEICGEVSGDRLIISVTDTGPGISAEDSEQIFEPFCQGTSDDSRRDKGGSGLGLTISKQFVELHGGQMWLKSQPGVGSTFYFTLPIHSDVVYSPKPDRWIQPDWIWHEETFKTARVEDAEKLVRPRIVAIDSSGGLLSELERFGDSFDLVCYKNEQELEVQTNSGQADLVWVNAVNPESILSGTAGLLRAFPGVPVIGSIFSDIGDAPKKDPNVLYLTKPITLEKLESALKHFNPAIRQVMVVDDDPDVQSLLQHMLRVCCREMEVSTVSNGPDALALLEQEVFELILLDVIMPGMNGWELLEHLRRSEKYQSLPVLFVSAQDLHNHQPASPFYLAASGDGFTIQPLLSCALLMANVFQESTVKPNSERH
jgi:signal transduction histidine kinase/CheY-like chemotaxis protein